VQEENIRYVSLYSGCGGLDLGFEAAGFHQVASFDHDATALATLEKNLGSRILNKDLSEPDGELIAVAAEADVLIAGPPCQGFSTAGKNDPKDYRNNHLVNVAEIASLARPKVVVIENVKGLLNPANSHHFEKTIGTLESAGYSVEWAIHDIADYGVAQTRVRVLIVAVLADKPLGLQLKCKKRLSLGEALKNLGDQNNIEKPTFEKGCTDFLISEKIGPGQKLSNVRRGLTSVHTWDIPGVFGPVSQNEVSFLETIVKLRRQSRRRETGDADPVSYDLLREYFGRSTDTLAKSLLEKKYLRKVDGYLDITNTFNGKYRRPRWDGLSPTVDTRFGQHRYFLHPDEHRGFSVREAARIQSFPDSFDFSESNSANYRMIGNAVPPRFAETIANCIREQWATL
jgi:DNA (cytosine-5)-methyltransferase 1